MKGKSQTLICWGLTCDGLVFCEGEVTDSHLLGANLRWISVLCRGSHRLSSTGGLPAMGLVPCPGGVADSHLLGANLRWISVLCRGSCLVQETT